MPIDASDTALSLGLKCDELAVQSFATLIDELAERRETETPQDLSRRRYFSRQSQFPAEGLIDWHQDAEQIAALVRASDYGPFGSPMVWPKVSINGRCFAVRKASIGAPAAGSAPGAIVARDDSPGLHIATATQSIHLEAFSRLEGKTLEVTEVATLASLEPGGCVTWPTEEVKKQITEVGRIASKATAYWRERLLACQPYRFRTAARCPTGGKSKPDHRDVSCHLRASLTHVFHRIPDRRLVHVSCAPSGTADVHVAIHSYDEVPAIIGISSGVVPLLAHRRCGP